MVTVGFLAVAYAAMLGSIYLRGDGQYPPFEPGYAGTHFFFLTLAAFIGLLCVARVRAGTARLLDRFAEFLRRRGAFRSNVECEAPKFGLIRILFGIFLTERAAYILLYLTPSDWHNPVIWGFGVANMAASVMVLLGFGTQIALAYFIFLHWQAGEFIMGTATLGNDIGGMLALLLVFANAGMHLSLDRMLVRRGGPVGRFLGLMYYEHGLPSETTLQMAKFLSLMFYWCVCVYSLSMHLNEPAWMTGTAGPLVLTNNFMSSYASEFAQFFTAHGTLAVLLGRISLWAMLPWYALVLPFVMLGGLFRMYVIFWAILFFSLSLFVLNLGWLAHFEFLFLAALFWEKRFILAPKTLHVAYDDRCNLCDRTVQFIKLVDFFRRVELRPLSQNEAWLKSFGIDPKDALTDLYGVETNRNNRVSKGYDFYMTLTRNIVVLLPLYPILLVGKWLRFGPVIYRFIAERRTKLFGVCKLPVKKMEYETLPPGFVAPKTVSHQDPVLAYSLHACLLALAYFVTMPAPFIGWNGVPFPEKIAAYSYAGPQASHIYGIAPINVFNHIDLHMSENWFTVSMLDADGKKTLLPIFTESGTRLDMHSSDRIYFGHTLRFRRGSIGSKGCLFESYRPLLAYLTERFDNPPGTVRFVFDQYHQPLPDEQRIVSGVFEVLPVQKVCTVTFGGHPEGATGEQAFTQ